MVRAYREEPQVLIIDDIAATRTLLRDMLREMGFTDIVEAKDGREALDKLKDHRAQLIICDNVMEGMCGLDLLYQLRNHAYLVDIPFIDNPFVNRTFVNRTFDIPFESTYTTTDAPAH